MTRLDSQKDFSRPDPGRPRVVILDTNHGSEEGASERGCGNEKSIIESRGGHWKEGNGALCVTVNDAKCPHHSS